MIHYSQQHVKVPATEPDHVMRKAEFDDAVGSLDERIKEVAAILGALPLDELDKAVSDLTEAVEGVTND
jgi:hypothetical protein